MKLQVSLVLLCLLYPRALALKCYQCIPDVFGNCTETQTDCPDRCISSTSTVAIGGFKPQFNMKTCAVQEDCIFGSINLKTVKTTVNSVCCSIDLCNRQKVPALSQQTQNGKQCYFCADSDCSGTVNCEGDEDHCIRLSATIGGSTIAMKGCASRSVCSASGLIMQATLLPVNITCCKGNLCNSAAGVTLSLFMMLGPLLSSVLFF